MPAAACSAPSRLGLIGAPFDPGALGGVYEPAYESTTGPFVALRASATGCLPAPPRRPGGAASAEAVLEEARLLQGRGRPGLGRAGPGGRTPRGESGVLKPGTERSAR